MRTLAAAIALLMLGAGHPALAQGARPKIGEKPQQMLYVAINVNDFEKAKSFYTTVVGLKEIPELQGHGPPRGSVPLLRTTFSFSGDYTQTFLMINHDRARAAPYQRGETLVRLVFKVPDTSAVVARARAGGYPVTREPTASPDQPGSSVAFIKDPDGNDVEIVQNTG